MTTYLVLEPDEWGMRWARPPVAERHNDPETYIHHRGGNPKHTTDAAEAFRELNEWTINVKGYSATDYDILVHENTLTDTVTIGIARGQWMSAATLERNEAGEAICALGYFHPGHSLSERPSPRMLEGLARAVALSIRRGWSAPDTTILGHRDNPAHPGATPCPGDYLYAELPTIRKRVAELLAPASEEPDMTPFRQRVYDSRLTGGRLKAGEMRRIKIGKVNAAFLNVQAVLPSANGYIEIWPGGARNDQQSVLTYAAGDVRSGVALTAVADDEHINVFSLAATDLVLEIQGVV